MSKVYIVNVMLCVFVCMCVCMCVCERAQIFVIWPYLSSLTMNDVADYSLVMHK